MKRSSLLVLFLLITVCSQAQTWSEWMRQKKTQIKYLGQQIAALKVYGDYLQDGYRIAKKGLGTIGEIRDGEWTLHKDYFRSLKVVNPSIMSWSRVAEVISRQGEVVRQTRSLVKWCQAEKGVDAQTMAYVQKVCDGLLKRSLAVLDELLLLTTNGELQLTDDERMEKIESIHQRMQEISEVSQAFGKAVIGLIRGVQREHNELKLSKILNAVK
ncbi:MAG TPA: hypothetical protein VMR70_01125 [Flavisolibacter sp.]|nr:hypothetical protein [Flavisolibacter sp.]